MKNPFKQAINATQNPDMQFFAIYDTKVGHYEEPMPARSKLDMIRQLENTFKIHGEKSKYFLNAEDYQLFSIAEYDKKTGNMETWQPEHVINLHDLKTQVQLQQNPAN